MSDKGMAVEAEYREPDPRPVTITKGVQGKTPERYYRYGYVVAGAMPMMVSEYCRRQEQAADMAEAAARRVRDKLREIGAPAEVTWWVQPWRVEKSEVFEDAQVVEL